MEQPETAKKRLSWNPFQTFESDDDIRKAAKASLIPAGYMAVSYLIQSLLMAFGSKDTFGNSGSLSLAIALTTAGIAGFLFWRVWVKQPVWAAIVLLLWFFTEMFALYSQILSGVQSTNPGYMIMHAAIAAATILGVRGSLALRKLRKTSVAEAFD